jgi:hypothetical protein
MTPKKESGLASQFADLVGIEGIHPPQRIEFLPYITSNDKFIRQDENNPFNKSGKLGGNFGTDLKIGLGSNMTLDAAINPDFGQVEVDPAVVNLSQYETYYDEKRPFFIEGANIFMFGRGGATNYWSFNWGDPNFFYSRRIGRAPQGNSPHDGYVDIPGNTTILGAAKMSGKIDDNWSIGALSALTNREHAETDSSEIRFKNEVEPMSSYNIIRTQREFNKGAQAIGIIGTATFRDLSDPQLAGLLNKQALALGVDGWTFLDSSKTWVITGWSGISHVDGSKARIINVQQAPQHYYQTPDQSYKNLDSSATSMSGWATRFWVNKQKGNFQFNAAFGIISPGFETNDLGYQWNGDQVNMHVAVGYAWFEPDKIFRTKSFNFAVFKNFDFGGKKIGDGYFLFWNGQFNNYYGTNMMFSYSPKIINDKKTRGGPTTEEPAQWSTNISAYSDSRKPVVFDLSYSFWTNKASEVEWNLYFNCGWKISDGIQLSFGPQYASSVGNSQWVTSVTDPFAIQTFGKRYIFSEFKQSTLSADIRLDWTFTPHLTLQLFLQPLFSVGKYSNLKELASPGSYTFNTFGKNGSTAELKDNVYMIDPDGLGPAPSFSIDNPNFNFKSLRGNAVLRWEFSPGSTFYFVWTHTRENTQDPGDFRPGRDFRTLMNDRGDNIFLIKLTYWWNL